jgi:hypothetical protein
MRVPEPGGCEQCQQQKHAEENRKPEETAPPLFGRGLRSWFLFFGLAGCVTHV